MNPLDDRIPRIALISPDPTLRSAITSCLEECAQAVDWVLRAESDVAELRPESVDRLAERHPELLFLDVGSSPAAGARFVSAISTLLPGLTVVAAGGSLGVDELLQLIRAGASGYLRRPWNDDEIREVCSGLLQKMSSKQVDYSESEYVTGSNVISLFAPKGGTGVSTLAANLAVHIRHATMKNTLLLDLSPEMGTSPVLLGAEPRYSYLDVVDSLHRMDERLFYSFLEEHESGTRILASPGEANTARELTPQNVHAIVRLVGRYFDYVVVDVGRGILDGAALKALELADERLMVTTAELPALRNLKQVLPYIPQGQEERGTSDESIRLVVNRFEEGISVPTKDIEGAVGIPLYQILEEDRERVGRSVNLGRPIVAAKTSSAYARSVRKLGDRLAADDLPANRKGSGLGGLIRTLIPPFGRQKASTEPRSEAPREPSSNGRGPQRSEPPRSGTDHLPPRAPSRPEKSAPVARKSPQEA